MRIGIDLGGTKIEGRALRDDGTEAVRRRVPTPRDYEASVDALAALVRDLEAETGQRGTVGVCIPGTIDGLLNVVKNANSTWLNGKRLDADLKAALGREVRIVNDANAFALSEAADGAGAGFETVFGVILGTGVGGGLVLDGRLVEGSNGIAGEWGHIPMPWPREGEWPGPPCYCGKTGCIETFLSGPGCVADHTRRTGQTLSTREIVRRAETGDAAATATLDRYVDRLARGIGLLTTIVDPDVFVLGGGMSNLPGLAARAEAEAAPWVFSWASPTSRYRDSALVRKNVHGDSSGVRGAAWLWPIGG